MKTSRPAQMPAHTASASSVSRVPFSSISPVEASQTHRDTNRTPTRLMPSTRRRSRDQVGTGSVSGGSGFSDGVAVMSSIVAWSQSGFRNTEGSFFIRRPVSR